MAKIIQERQNARNVKLFYMVMEDFFESLKGPIVELLDLKTEMVASYLMDQSPVQDSFRYRARHLGLKVAQLLLDEQGELIASRLVELTRFFDTQFILGPGRESDILIFRHIARCLKVLEQNWTAIRRFSLPLCHKRAEEMVRETLWPESIRVVQTVHIRKAVLAAWLTLLRQATGSCFATAPAILIQSQYPVRFFKDLYDLLSVGQLKRVVAGREYTVPLSPNSGKGDLQRVAPLDRSPGVRAALEAAGVAWTTQVQERLKEPQMVERAIRDLLLQEMGLSEEDLTEEESLAKIQMAPLLAKQSGIYYQKPSERGQKISDWKKRMAKALTTFKAYTECALLRAWEYSLASLCDVKTEFARWNLYVGLGINPDEKEGLGNFLYEQIDVQLQKCNLEIERLEQEYQEAAGALQALEAMLNNSASDVRRNQLKAELMAISLSVNTIVELRNQKIGKAESLREFFSSLIRQIDEKLQENFQELFDPALIGQEAHLFDDSSAGFRLVYKHRRRDASQWTEVYDGEQYIEALRDFFSQLENEIVCLPQIEREFVTEIITGIIRFIKDDPFLEGAMQRAKKLGRRSPWDYTSGGTLQTLLGAYCNRERPFTELSITPRSTEELIRFVAQVKGEQPMLIHSPTHAFLFLPELLPKGNFWNQPAARKWNPLMQEHLVHRISERLPEEERGLFIHLYRKKESAASNSDFRKNLIDALSPRIAQGAAVIDSVLYEQTPLFDEHEAKRALEKIVGHSVQVEGNYFGSRDLFELAKGSILKKEGAISSVDWDRKMSETMRQLGLSSPYLFLFADTNWSGWFFGFVVNPATGNLELWRLNRTATQGYPMTDWTQWMAETNTSAWTLLSNPHEYGEG